MMKSKLMSQKYVTQLLNRNDLYKDGDYTDVFINQDIMRVNIHEYNANKVKTLQLKQKLSLKLSKI